MDVNGRQVKVGDTFTYGRITVEFRGESPPRREHWIAFLDGDRKRYDAGSSMQAAIGNLVLSWHDEMFGPAIARAAKAEEQVAALKQELEHTKALRSTALNREGELIRERDQLLDEVQRLRELEESRIQEMSALAAQLAEATGTAKACKDRGTALAAIAAKAHDYDQNGPATDSRFEEIYRLAMEAP